MAVQASTQQYSEPEYAKTRDRAKVLYYHVNIEHKIPQETHELLETYSHLPRELHSEHVHKIRDEAFDIRAYPCTGTGVWLVPQLCRLPNYPEVLARVKEGATLMDVGTFIGHDLRRLVYDGAPSEKLYGVDIVDHFSLGYKFFRDRDHFNAHFIEADFLSNKNASLNALNGAVDITVISQVLHQWDWAGQIKAATALIKFTKPGAMIVGNQIGNVRAHKVRMNLDPAPPLWRHNPQSWAEMWKAIGNSTGTQWETEAWLRSFPEMGWLQDDAAWMEEGVRVMEFVTRRIA